MFPLLLVAAALLAVGLRESIDPGILGLAIVYAISLSGILQLMVSVGHFEEMALCRDVDGMVSSRAEYLF